MHRWRPRPTRGSAPGASGCSTGPAWRRGARAAARLAFGLVRVAIGLAGFWWISRANEVVAKIAIGLSAVGGLGTSFLAATAPAGDRISFALVAAVFFGIAIRLATSAPFWAYVRAQRGD